MKRLGFMQGRLLPPSAPHVIQEFPKGIWEQEFPLAREVRLEAIEWTLDYDGIDSNPIMTPLGRKRIRELSISYGVQVISVTGDCFMHEPFWKSSGLTKQKLLALTDNILSACQKAGANILVVPLVDSGSIENVKEYESVVNGFLEFTDKLRDSGVKIAFESDMAPKKLAHFISKFPKDCFGINYDIGNSASLNFDPEKEFSEYSSRIINIHVKDRVRGGGTVPLGEGDANFEIVFRGLRAARYRGNFVLQTARSREGFHQEALKKYAEMTTRWLFEHKIWV